MVKTLMDTVNSLWFSGFEILDGYYLFGGNCPVLYGSSGL